MKRNIFFLIICITFGAASCKKNFLDVPDNTNILRQSYVVDLKSTGEFLNGVYTEIAMNLYAYESLVYPEIIADNIKPPTPSSPNLTAEYTWSQKSNDDKLTYLNATQVNVNTFWYRGYRIIRDCSFIIETIDKYRNEDAVKADNIKGQAYAIRALVHAYLVNVFAQPFAYSANGAHPGIPYITTSDWGEPVVRQTVADVYNGLITDLTNAVPLLPAVQLVNNAPTVWLFNRNAAKALLARVYLFKGDYTPAKDIAKEVLTAVPMMTGANYPGKLFSTQETEALFQLPPAVGSATVGAGPYGAVYVSYFFVAPNLQYVSTSDIATILKEYPQDVRNTWVTQSGSAWNITKYPQNLITGFPTVSYQTLLRSSEMYLTVAESFAKLNNEDSSRFYLDAIRKRANPSIAGVTATGSALLDSVYKERRKELCFEGLRMFDLLRLKKGVNRIDAPNPLAKDLPFPSEKAIAPLPLSDVMISGLSQNPGY